MSAKYKLLIDESGEAGISKIRSSLSGGASPYMTLGAAIVPADQCEYLLEQLTFIASQVDKDFLHCSELKHAQKVFYARSASKFKMRLFGVISKKETLGTYKQDISNDSKMYYNKCAQYLLERVGMFMEERQIDKGDLEIIFEEANCDYEKLKNLIRTCQRNPLHTNSAKLKFIDVDNFLIKSKKDEPLLQIADLVAHSLYKCIDKQPKNFHIPEPRYLQELSSRFFGNSSNNKVVNYGIYCVHSTADLSLDLDIKNAIDQLEARPLKSSS
jgi:hypothetical protein